MICKLYCEDNLVTLSRLDDNTVDLIYCDVLYATGKKFVDYDDLKANRQTIIDFYSPRLVEMFRVLKNTGTIYLQCDIRINHWLRQIMDDVFGYENFRNEIVVKYNIGGYGKREFAKKHDYLIVYSKTNQYTFNSDKIRIPYKSVISKSTTRPNITPEKYELGTVPTNVWDDIPNGLKVKKKTDYFSEKHEKLLERIILASSNETELVADFFLGSGTTAAVCQRLNRNFIGCDINPRSIQITKQRLCLT